MTFPSIGSKDQAATIRATTAAILAAAGTLAGSAVDQERVDPIQDGDVPRLVVYMDTTAQTDSTAGTAVRFTVTGNLTIACLVQQAVPLDALNALDTLIAQVKYALFCNSAWVELSSNVATYRVTTSLKSGGEFVTGDARIQMTLTWFETYEPDITTPLHTIMATATLTPTGAPVIAELLNTAT